MVSNFDLGLIEVSCSPTLRVTQREVMPLKRQFVLFLTALLFLLSGFDESLATVEWDVRQTLKIEKSPRDAVM